ncbi:hypothetical protein [Pseudonocardia acaciae]|uniref:hypothetical protein n=1 Tax=Pseudonocardia acaciae TaxID=551276 RepID=UPI000686B83B|nr:hypothetical protein [Pseudonocardia acaciae]
MTGERGLHGAYLRKDLIERLGRYRVDADIQRGVLRRLWPGVLVDASRFLDPRTRAAAALLSHGSRSVIAGATATGLHGCTAIECADTHIAVPYGHPSRSRDGLAVHNCPLPPDDVIDIDGLRVLTLDRVISDLLCTARPRDAIAATDQALACQPDERRAAFRARVGQRLADRRDPRGTKRGARLLGLASGRAESPPESWLLLEVVDLGYPVPEANWELRAPDGVLLYRLDLAWPEQRIVVEYNGYAVHVDREAEDECRAEDLRRRGWIVIVATKDDLRDNTRLALVLRQSFRRRGHRWSDEIRDSP